MKKGFLVAMVGLAVLISAAWWRFEEPADPRQMRELLAARPASAPVKPPTSEPAEEPAEEPALSAENILERAKDKWTTVNDYHCTAQSFYRLGEASELRKWLLDFKRPDMYRTKQIEGNRPGAIVTKNADGVIHGKSGGILGLVVMTLKDDDPRIRSIRGTRFCDSNFGIEIEALERAVEAGWTLERLADQTIDGAACFVLSATGAAGEVTVSCRQLSFDAETNLLRRVREFEGETLVRDSTYSEIEINTNPSDTIFSLK